MPMVRAANGGTTTYTRILSGVYLNHNNTRSITINRNNCYIITSYLNYTTDYRFMTRVIVGGVINTLMTVGADYSEVTISGNTLTLRGKNDSSFYTYFYVAEVS